MIAHFDVDSFFASVLIRKDPSLRGRPLIAAGMGGGCVIAATYEAKAKGIRTGMRISDARKLMPEAIVRPTDFAEASLASKQIEGILQNICPLVQPMSIDEWFLDLTTVVGGVPKKLEYWMRALQNDIRSRTSLSVSGGAASSKLLAKMAGEYKKPSGIVVLQSEQQIVTFLKDRPAAAIPGVGRKRVIQTDALELQTAYDVRQADTPTLHKLWGKTAGELQRELRGECLSHVSIDYEPPKSISRCRSFRPTPNTDLALGYLTEHLAHTVLRLRRHELACNGIYVWLRYGNFQFHKTGMRLPVAADTQERIYPFMKRCFDAIREPHIRYTQVGLALWDLRPPDSTQQSLFDDQKQVQRDQKLQKSLDALHKRYGRGSIVRAPALSIERHWKDLGEIAEVW